ncbi:MAG TPA: hypothetical protein VN426_10415 [Syntrophomonadaceae bacterium]|nr:hypothetical protein [Syntrophomonadaceae bacterium]
MKVEHSQIQIEQDLQKNPYRIFVHSFWHQVIDIKDQWADTGEWWAGTSEKMFYRLQLDTGQVMEIYQDLMTHEWWLYKVCD